MPHTFYPHRGSRRNSRDFNLGMPLAVTNLSLKGFSIYTHGHTFRYKETCALNMLIHNIDILLDTHKNHSLVQLIEPETLSRFQSVIIGFDVYSNEILLGGIYPSPNLRLLDKLTAHPFWLQCACDGRYLNIYVAIEEVIHGGELLSVRVLQSELTDNRRWSPRCYFDSHSGPPAELITPFGAIEKAYVKNISQHGALIECFGRDLRTSLGNKKHLQTNLTFNSQYSLSTKVSVQQCSFRRSPCCHSSLRVKFDDLHQVEALQIREFMEQSIDTPQVA